ncbi:MAG: hypothetical protein JKY89_01270 [Immundisolibacteraceae bacterium]|nr:hypothetical protein [Immundisolibacteraceae bacterium]
MNVDDFDITSKKILEDTPTYGRPKIEKSKRLVKKVAISFTQEEYEILKDRAGRLPLAIYLKSKVFPE